MREESEEIVHGCYHLSTLYLPGHLYCDNTAAGDIADRSNYCDCIFHTYLVCIWYAKRKVRRHMEEYENEWNQQQEEYTTGNNSNLDSDDVIDVEFTERDDE